MTVDSPNIRDITTYRELLATFEPRPVRTEAEADALTELLDELTDIPDMTEGQRDFAALIGQLLYDWESVHEEPVEASPQELVRSLLEDNDYRQVDLVGPVFPTASAVSDFLAGPRSLSYDRVQKLVAFFHVSPVVFFSDQALTSPHARSSTVRIEASVSR